ncbi:hypothetical protein [Kosakonia cowanii]|uniref:hypothetical protein n=1 Tax=Kosakonia cowanii TaxID=208223 RepID=UPI00345BAD32
MREFWTEQLKPDLWKAVSEQALNAAKEACKAGILPDSTEGQQVARDWLEGSASAMNRCPDAAFIQWHHRQFEKNAGPVGRYRELMSLVDGRSETAVDKGAWQWLDTALGSLHRK